MTEQPKLAKTLGGNVPDLQMTAYALAGYDAFMDNWGAALLIANSQELGAMDAKREQLEKTVGICFGLDTADRNSPQTCAECIRPGPKVPPSGQELSFVRRMVRIWEQSRQQEFQ